MSQTTPPTPPQGGPRYPFAPDIIECRRRHRRGPLRGLLRDAAIVLLTLLLGAALVTSGLVLVFAGAEWLAIKGCRP